MKNICMRNPLVLKISKNSFKDLKIQWIYKKSFFFQNFWFNELMTLGSTLRLTEKSPTTTNEKCSIIKARRKQNHSQWKVNLRTILSPISHSLLSWFNIQCCLIGIFNDCEQAQMLSYHCWCDNNPWFCNESCNEFIWKRER